MSYTTAQAAQKMGISAHTLRFYDKEGLLPNVGRDEHGNRRFTDNDLQWLSLLQCLKNTGMSLKDIKRFAKCTTIGDSTIEERLALFENQTQNVKQQLSELKRYLSLLEYKVAFYQQAKALGSVQAVAEMMPEIPK
ncbi:MerR family transcriptional regulator [Aggregatibacter actinomycetemcomitans]|uniref:MerR family transcriptional regulator n=1 Tax=Aggregatibacter actinomycetemcomitans TaxID=714 RepID=A0A5D0EM80_AGGAC|nr:MerR family transcriptional regulator [Aggregatibacter actinomycetemcomitans]AFI86920.1 MerR family transcriptional regulator [Aggregatibacter actinomycetemcomitans D7S-1]KYK95564.1 MerR family transcriptional regulator [Aggregatibacter actinomycetemcomitans serotype d str. SA3733]AMQ94046.1 MerR family transcriptional regulator [Aggregatibacter actinomycetemcomitans]ANU82160.1 MerR family transcriptional regulator [Aggregatibacter actinomycetemcomitans]EKX96014.1 transcriptional regulator,